MPKLTIVLPGKGSAEFTFERPVTIGRDKSNDLVIPDQGVSRFHCRIFQSSGQWHIIDLGTANGTKVNGFTCGNGEQPIEFGARIAIGKARLTFSEHVSITSSNASATPPPVIPAPPAPPPVQTPPPVFPWDEARQRQSQTVLDDPKYILDTGFGIGCPQCGSGNLINLGKAGSGLSYFGSLGWVVGMSLVEGFLSQYQGCTISCNYCGYQFTA